MSKFNWKKLVGTVAPSLATALGGPLAGMATAAIAKAVLGDETASDARLEAALAGAGPDVLLKLKEADQAFEIRMQELGVDLVKLENEDRDSARNREAKTGDSWTPRILSGVVMAGFFGCVGFVLAGKVDVSGEAGVLIGTLVGYASAKADQVISYYFGSSAGSKAKSEALARGAK